MRKKSLLSKLMLLLCALVVGSSSALADTYEQLTSIANIDESAQYVLGIDGTGFHYEGTSSWGKTALPSAHTPLYYTLKKASDGNSFTAQTTISGTTYYLQIPTSNTFSMATSTGTNTDIIIGTTQVSGTNYAVANKTTTARHLRINGTSGLRSYAGTTGTMAFFYKVVSSFTITAQSNNTNYGTVSLSGTTITATPAKGYRVSTTTPYTVTSGSATVTQDGNTFEVNASSECTVTINFEAKPTVQGYNINFESDLDLYVDWTFTNIGTSNTAISAHNGSKYGANINGSGNGVETASIQTNDQIALPGVFTCYVSKASTNTTSSKWTLYVSADGTTWTEVATQAAQSMGKGEWVEFTANLSGYSDVYVRLSYGNSSAIRAVDDISITMRDPNTKITPTITIDATGLTTNDVAGSSNVDAGTLSASVVSGETIITTPAVTWSSDNTSVATINASGAVTLIATGTTTITASFAGNDDYNEATATYELTVIDSKAKGGENNPYTVAEAIDNTPSSGNVYIKGIVSSFQNTSIVGDGNNFRYNISDDGTTSNQLLVYKGKKSSTEAFSSADDLEIGDVVVIYGELITYNNAAEVASGNYIVSRTTKTASDLTKTGNISLSMANPSVTATATDFFTTSSSGNLSYEIAEEAVATVSAVGVVTPVAAGTTTLTVSQAADATYKAGSLEITVTVAAASLNETTIAANPSGSTTYGTNKVEGYMISDTYDGAVAAVSSNPSVATVTITQHTAGEGTFTITPVAVGTAVITISAPATTTCEAADDVAYTITVTAPEGKTTVPAIVAPVTIDFTSNNFSLPTSSSDATTGDITDGTFTLNVSGGNGAYYYSDGDALLMGKSGATLTLPTFNNEITKIDVVGSSKAGTNVKQNIYVGETAVSTETTGAKDVTNEYVINPNYQAAGTQYLLKVTSSHNTQITSITLNFASAGTLSAKLNASGYATYCSEYPLDFSDYETAGYSAWQITDISAENVITFSQVKGSVKGGTGLLLKGEANATVSLTSVNSTNELGGNFLEGTLAPTYVEANKYYGLSGDKFVKVKAGTVKAGKALLNADWITEGSSARQITFIFEDDNTTTGISEELRVKSEESFYNLNGQRVNDLKKGGLYIVGGKKVIVK